MKTAIVTTSKQLAQYDQFTIVYTDILNSLQHVFNRHQSDDIPMESIYQQYRTVSGSETMSNHLESPMV